jgi:hypothetical protein
MIIVGFVRRSCDSMSVIIIFSMILSLTSIGIVVILTEKHLKNLFGE